MRHRIAFLQDFDAGQIAQQASQRLLTREQHPSSTRAIDRVDDQGQKTQHLNRVAQAEFGKEKQCAGADGKLRQQGRDPCALAARQTPAPFVFLPTLLPTTEHQQELRLIEPHQRGVRRNRLGRLEGRQRFLVAQQASQGKAEVAERLSRIGPVMECGTVTGDRLLQLLMPVVPDATLDCGRGQIRVSRRRHRLKVLQTRQDACQRLAAQVFAVHFEYVERI